MKPCKPILLFQVWMVIFSIAGITQNKFLTETNITRTLNRPVVALSQIADTLMNKDEEFTFSKDQLENILNERKAVPFILGKTNENRNIEAWFFPGTSIKKALVIGGVHGSELSSIEVAEILISNLMRREKPYYNVIIIPGLFPDNAYTAKENQKEIGSTANLGRYGISSPADPNRQMPSPGKPFYEEYGKDHFEREIDPENKLLLKLIAIYHPDRIASIHAIRNISKAGIFADPRTDNNSIALGFETDSMLAIEMSRLIRNNNGHVPGNFLNGRPTALYYKDPVPVEKGKFQKRNFSGTILPQNRGSGVSLGTWASTAISSETDPAYNRKAMRILTIEFPGYKRPVDYKTASQQKHIRKLLKLYASSIENIFLEKYLVEGYQDERLPASEFSYCLPDNPDML
ncbi:MAG: hypothetical protein IT214_02705 [Chitinophagaceae bacterium]|nr:hypothetical protein [Chitinophagaceae bacterium]